MAKKRTRYTDDFRANAVLMLEAAGYPDTPGALQRVAAALKMPHQTLSSWARAVHNPPPPEVRQEKRGELVELIRAEIRAALNAAENVRIDASYRDLMTGVGILTDKLQLLEGKPTENVVATEHVIEYRIEGAPSRTAPWAGNTTAGDGAVQRRGLWATLGQDDGGDDPVH